MTGNTLKLKNIRLAFTKNLFVPASYKNDPNKPKKFQCQLLLAKDHPQLADLNKEIVRLAGEEWKDKAPQVLASIKGSRQKYALQDGDLSLYEGFPGNWSINASRRESDGRPLFLRANPGTKDKPNLATESDLYAGSFVVAHISFWTNNKEGPSIQANLLGLQVYRPGEAFSGGAATSLDEFGNEEAETVTVGSGGGFDAFA